MLVFISIALTFYPLILKSQPRNHSRQSLACEAQTPAKEMQMSDKFKYQLFGNFCDHVVSLQSTLNFSVIFSDDV